MKYVFPHTGKGETSSDISGRYYFIVFIAILASIAGIIQNTIQFFTGIRDWQFLANYLLGIVGFVLSIIAYIWIRQQKIAGAGKLLITFAILNGLLASFVFKGIGLSMQMVISVAGLVIAYEMIPPQQRTFVIGIVLTSGAVAFGMDLLPPLWRIPAISPTYNYLFVLILLILFVLYIFRNFFSYTLQTRLMYVVLGINLLAVLLIALAIIFLTQQFITRGVERKLTIAASAMAENIDDVLSFELAELKIKANSGVFQDYLSQPAEQRDGELTRFIISLISTWESMDTKNLRSYSLLGRAGEMIFTNKASLVENEEASITYIKQALLQQAPYISPVYYLNKEKRVITFICPIPNSDTEKIIGFLRMHLDASFLQSFSESFNNLSGKDSYGVIIDDLGILIANGNDSTLNQQLIAGLSDSQIQGLQNVNRLLPVVKWLDLPELRNQLTSETITPFRIPLIASSLDQQAIAVIKPLKQQPWNVMVLQPEESAIAPVNEMTLTIIIATEIVALLVIIFGTVTARYLTDPIQKLTIAAQAYTEGNFDKSYVKVNSQDELGFLASTFNKMVLEIQTTIEGLDESIQEKKRGIETSAEIGRRLSAILEPSRLAREVVNQLQSAFNYYHVQIYLLDSTNAEILYLAGGTGVVGEELMRQGHHILVGSGSVGRAAKNKSIILIPDTSKDSGWLANPLLPDTKAEAAVPILLGKDLLGVLDVQQRTVNSLSAQDTDLLQLISSQVATALRNASLLIEAHKRAGHETRMNQILEQIQKNPDMELTAKIAVREIGRLASSPNTVIHLRE